MHILITAILQALQFRDVDPESITNVESNVGVVWFKANGIDFSVSIQELEDSENPMPAPNKKTNPPTREEP